MTGSATLTMAPSRTAMVMASPIAAMARTRARGGKPSWELPGVPPGATAPEPAGTCTMIARTPAASRTGP